MSRYRAFRAAVGLPAAAVFSLIMFIPSAVAQSGGIDPELLGALAVRNIGPANLGGRIDDIEVPLREPNTIYFGHAAGGVFKSINGGTTFEPVFDEQISTSIGDIAVAPSNPSIVWVGTGEPNNRQSSSWGNGVYRSMDGGLTWRHMGLEETHHIGRIRIHPTDPMTVWVAALGHLWGPNEERGVYLTTDGGQTWQKTLYINDDTGVIDLALDHVNPHILYAAAYQRRRTGFGFNGGGPHGGIYKSTDSGRTWRKLDRDLPEGDIGRIGLDIYHADTRVVYAIIENRTEKAGQIIGGERIEEPTTMGGVYRSDDRGETWSHQSTTNPRPMYYSQIRIDPNNDLHVWVLDTSMYVSRDGGITWDTRFVDGVHVDHHALWWDPNDSRHIIIGNDGGLDWTRDGGRTWVDMQTIPLAQYYEISADEQEPFYKVYGGLQDNGTWVGASGNYFRICLTNRDWMTIYGGDGFYCVPEPGDPTVVYAESQSGNLGRVDMTTLSRTGIRPQPPEGDDERYRFNWNSPLEISPHNPARIYYGGNRLFISDDRGDTWERTDDLTRQIDRDELEIMGVVNREITLSRNDGISRYGTITTISESPHTAGILWIGTDDGNLQLSRDAGRTWTNVIERVPGVPERTYVTRIEASRHEAGRAYVTFDGHRNDDFTPYVFVTEDFGRRWRPLAAGIPQGSNANVIREHHRNPELLFLGTERGAYWSCDRGTTWNLFEGDLPRVPVDDIYVHPIRNDLIVGTHARGAWIMDDIGPLEGMSAELLAGSYMRLFPMRTAWRFDRASHLQDQGDFLFRAPNPPDGVVISYWLPGELGEDERLDITVRDADGAFVTNFEGTGKRGLNRVTWGMSHTLEEAETGTGGFGRGGPAAVPGTYTVHLVIEDLNAGPQSGSSQVEQGAVQIRMDPRLEGRWNLPDLVVLRDVQLEAMRMLADLSPARERLQVLQERVRVIREFLDTATEVPPAATEALAGFRRDLSELTGEYFGGRSRYGRGGDSGTLEDRIMEIYSEAAGTLQAPAGIMERLQALRPQIGEAFDRVNAFLQTRVPEVNRALAAAGITFIEAGDALPPPGNK